MVYSRTAFTKIFLGLVLILQMSCSWMGVRTPSGKPAAATISVDEVFSITAGVVSKIDQKQIFMDSMGFQGINNAVFEYILSPDLPENTAFKIELDIVKDKFTYRILHSKTAFKDPAALYELGTLMTKLKDSPVLSHNLSMFEMYYNAREGDQIALDNFLKIRATPAYYNSIEGPSNEILLERSKTLQEMREELAPQIKVFKAERKVIETSRKKILDKLDKAPEGKQFRALVAKGDRNGAADLLQKYLPFEDMAPFEKRFWDTHIEVMRNPVPLDQRVLIYRGLNDDYIHSAVVGGEELTKADAIKENKAFVMSSVLVKNQGSWNRRLRSLEAMNEKFIATINNDSEFAQSARISTIFLKHSGNPQGSPFISLTPNIGVAESFGQKQLMSALIDPRLIHFNYVSSFNNEIEFLMPLTTFPDEMVGLWTSDAPLAEREYLEERLKIRVSDEFGKGKAEDIIKRIKKNSADFFAPVYNDGQPKITKTSGGSMAEFYKKFAKTKGTIKPALTPKGDLNCSNLIKIFWTVP